MEIIETIILIVAWVFTIIWMYGVRIKAVFVTTALISLLILLLTSLFTFTNLPKYHLLWAIPLTMFAGTHVLTFIIVNVPILNSIVITIGKIYTRILQVGISKEMRQQMAQGYQKEMSEMLHNLSDKKSEEINGSK